MILPNGIDFETKGIEPPPDYPPKPVGMSVYEVGKRPKYWAFGHPVENNCTWEEARKEAARIWSQKRPIVAHNWKFDGDVAQTWFDLPFTPPGGYEDTMIQAFLVDPHARSLELKKLAVAHLGIEADEQDLLHQWILDNLRTTEKSGQGDVVYVGNKTKPPKGLYRIPPSKAGAFICYAPGKLAGKYANGDTMRCVKLHKPFSQYIKKMGMVEAYQRELKLMPILLENEKGGIRTDYPRLRQDVERWQHWVSECDSWLRRKLKAPDLNIDSGEDLADALENSGMVEEWVYTEPSKTHPEGQRSTSKENIQECVLNKDIVSVLQYRSAMVKTISSFGIPWVRMGERNNGFINTSWSQVRQAKNAKDTKGARTGRLQSTPNFQNITKRKIQVTLPAALRRKLGFKEKTDGIPYLRDYIIPDKKSHVLLNRDYKQQELRILGHFEDGVLLDTYQRDPHIDFHNNALALVQELLGDISALTRQHSDPRVPLKNMAFGLIYGMGIGKLAETMGVDVETAKMLKSAYLSIFPGVKTLIDDLKAIGKSGDFLRTWGGRIYFVEDPIVVRGRKRTFEYKLLNYLIQGSAADCTKQALINYDSIKKDGRFILTVHDEIMIDCPKKSHKREMRLLEEAMADVDFDIPMLSDGKSGDVSWFQMTKWVD